MHFKHARPCGGVVLGVGFVVGLVVCLVVGLLVGFVVAVGFGVGPGLGCTVELLISNWLHPSQPHKQMDSFRRKYQLIAKPFVLVHRCVIFLVI